MIDDGPYPDGRGRANAARNFKQVEEKMLALDLNDLNEEVYVKEEANEEFKVNMDWL